MGVVILLIIIGSVLWFAGPAIHGTIQQKRRALEVRTLTRQTIRDMNKATKNDRRIW